jgi:hypothetical protein
MKGCVARKHCGGRPVAGNWNESRCHRGRRQDLLDLLDQLMPKIQELTRALEQEVEKRPVTRQLITHPGGPVDGVGVWTGDGNSGTL